MVALANEVKFGWPITVVAASPLENGAVYSNTLLLPSSATHKLPDESNARPIGEFSLVALGVKSFVVKLDWPITVVALCPLVKAYAAKFNGRIHAVKPRTSNTMKVFLKVTLR
ncbi:hypothetical protein NSIN_20424 [Nitrosotalea sinensis]|uniref:Uncharacterized protein n=1 Tax=Nitrosotalea sinensis TaxID=1499975 RepID=A0A2H1EG84_9ARCH|nr:hypothetical protein NSIN_20424 [Candidatus Nitrosotalea sinensis]